MTDEKIKSDSIRCTKIVNSILGREGISIALEILTATLVMVCQNQGYNAYEYLATMRRQWKPVEKKNDTEKLH